MTVVMSCLVLGMRNKNWLWKYLEKVNRYLQCRLKLSPGWGAVSRQFSLSCWCYYSWRLQATRFVARCVCYGCGNLSPVPSGHAPFEYSLKVIIPIKWVISKLSVFLVGNSVSLLQTWKISWRNTYQNRTVKVNRVEPLSIFFPQS